MNINEIKKLKVGNVYENVPFKECTTYKLEGMAKCMVSPNNLDSLLKLLNYLKENKLNYKIIGGGSNLIFKDEVYDGVLIKLNCFDKLEIMDNMVRAGSGVALMKVAIKMSKLGYTGLEFACGIPGTIGGAIFNNAGAYKSDMGYVVMEATVLTPNMEIKVLKNREMDFHYRTSFFKKNPGYVILETKIFLKKGKKEEIELLIEDRKKRRIESQPLEYPSAGSVFRNPDTVPAGKLIEDLGFKGKNVNGAYVSLKHANFIVNKGNAKGEDVIKLINMIKKEAKEKNNIELVLEQEIV